MKAGNVNEKNSHEQPAGDEDNKAKEKTKQNNSFNFRELNERFTMIQITRISVMEIRIQGRRKMKGTPGSRKEPVGV